MYASMLSSNRETSESIQRHALIDEMLIGSKRKWSDRTRASREQNERNFKVFNNDRVEKVLQRLYFPDPVPKDIPA